MIEYETRIFFFKKKADLINANNEQTILFQIFYRLDYI